MQKAQNRLFFLFEIYRNCLRAFLSLTVNKFTNPSGYSCCGTNLAFACIDGELWPELICPACLSAEDNYHGVPQIVAKNMSAAPKRNPFTRDSPPHHHTHWGRCSVEAQRLNEVQRFSLWLTSANALTNTERRCCIQSISVILDSRSSFPLGAARNALLATPWCGAQLGHCVFHSRVQHRSISVFPALGAPGSHSPSAGNIGLADHATVWFV